MNSWLGITIDLEHDSNIDESEPGYLPPEEDKYLQDFQNKVMSIFKDLLETKSEEILFRIIENKIHGPSSSSYPNYYKITALIFDTKTAKKIINKFERIVKEYDRDYFRGN